MLTGDGRSWAGVGSCVQLAEWVGDRSRAKASGQDQDLRWRHRGLTQGKPLMWSPSASPCQCGPGGGSGGLGTFPLNACSLPLWLLHTDVVDRCYVQFLSLSSKVAFFLS